MASGFYKEIPALLPKKSVKFKALRKNSKEKKAITGVEVEHSAGWAENMLMVSELQKKILIFRDVIDLPPCNQSGSIHQLIRGTIEDLRNLYPNVGSCNMREMSIHQGLINLYDALESIAAIWAKNNQWMTNSEEAGEVNLKSISLDQLGGRVLTKLNHMTKIVGQIFDAMEEDEGNNGNRMNGATFGNILNEPYLDKKITCVSPDTPDCFPSVTEQNCSWKPPEFTDLSFSPPRLLPLRIQSVDKLMLPDMKAISINVSQHILTNSYSPMKDHSPMNGAEKSDRSDAENLKGDEEVPMEETCEMPEDVKAMDDGKDHDATNLNVVPPITKMDAIVPTPALLLPPLPPSSPNKSSRPPPPIPPSQISSIPSPSLPPTMGSIIVPSIPPPPVPPSNGSMPVPPPPLPQGKGGAPPPPPPGGMAKALRAKRVSTKLKRSTHMGRLYSVLKGKVEGVEPRKSFHGKKGRIGGGSVGAKQGMADALAEITKRSAYFHQIEEDVQKHGNMIKELKAAISACQAKDMAELLKFHRYVEDNLEKLSDETQVLARFEGFPTKKLEVLRTAAALYLKLEGIARELENWKIAPPLSQLLDKVEAYFTKIKAEIDAIETTKDEETKRFQSQNIHFDFSILVRIKESMVDVSSGCMELALEEEGEMKAAANLESSNKTEGRTKACVEMLWRAFQLAFRVYNFAGGQDDRADRLTRQLALEIESDPPRQ